MFKVYFLLIILIASAASGQAQQHKKRIDALLSAYEQHHQFSGNVLIIENDKAMFEKCYGLADRENLILNKPTTRFRIASISKQFTAVLILQLVEAGKLHLDAPLTRYLPYYAKPWGKNITIHHLLTHTSGLPEFTEKTGFLTNSVSGHTLTGNLLNSSVPTHFLLLPVQLINTAIPGTTYWAP